MKCKDCNVLNCPYRTTDAEKRCEFSLKSYNESAMPASIYFPFDWDAFRREAAKDFISSFIQCGYAITDEQINRAIEYADKLIKQLKEEKK